MGDGSDLRDMPATAVVLRTVFIVMAACSGGSDGAFDGAAEDTVGGVDSAIDALADAALGDARVVDGGASDGPTDANMLFDGLQATDASPDAGAAVCIERVSVAPNGAQGNSASYQPQLSHDGHKILFASSAQNLGPVTGPYQDVFLRDRVSNTVVSVSVASSGGATDGQSHVCGMSLDSNLICETSYATNLVAADTNARADVFVRNMLLASTQRVNVSTAGAQANPIIDIPFNAAMSGDGRFVVFQSNATNLVPGDTNSADDIFLHDRLTGVTSRESVAADGSETNNFADSARPALSDDGRYIAFSSSAFYLVPGHTDGVFSIYVRDRALGTIEYIAKGDSPSLTPDGRFVVFFSGEPGLVPDDTNGRSDLFVFDRLLASFDRVNVSSAGSQAEQSMFSGGSISADGRFVAFSSDESHLVTNDTNGAIDAFVRDRFTHRTERVSVSCTGTQGNANIGSGSVSISRDGRWIAFSSSASNLVPGDTNGSSDVFVVPNPLAP